VDVGTGDGLFVYNCARMDRQTFFIGIDANRQPLEKTSHKIYRKPARGGLPNALFLQASAETLPDELNGVASEVYVNFPWGSLLAGVTTGDGTVLSHVRRICVPNALLKMIVGVDPEKDRAEIDRLQLPPLTVDYLNHVLAAKYNQAGFQIVETEALSPAALRELHTSWARRLQPSSTRAFVQIVARAVS
jgi:16S rRNA (adenine(1408)-N(1))-methyltransferase